MAAVWSEFLGSERVGKNDNFFELGGHSLLAMQVLSRIRETFRIEISPTVLDTGEFTVAALAGTVSKEQIRQADPQEIATMLKRVSELSDEEVQALLADPDRPVRD